MQWGGLLLGETTSYVGVQLTGWDDLPDIENGTVAMPTQHGAWPGPLLAGARSLTWDFRILPARRQDFPLLLDQLRRVTGIRQEEQPLVIQLAGARRLMWARITKRALPADQKYTRGEPTGSLVWEASDPRRYEVTQQAAKTRLARAEPGLEWPLAWPLDWDSAKDGDGWLEAENTGEAASHPVVVFHGPLKLPALLDEEGGRALEYAVALGPDDTLTVDCAAGTALLNGSISRLDTATARSAPERTFTLEPGVTRFRFSAERGLYDPRASVSIFWRSAFW
ncbi:phage tail family protein [Streptomyces auratus AGR0001]|nr:phage tail domain-containing protein [Streptomyces auratus]QTZ93655.1 phage tail family protein [Streptomyces auratus AGR0001]